ncbi:MAG: NUDIX domain-containing protein [Planctomycetes bacterium]|nr:NUDIX domain-containing protein [Planctomycetota bacterium]
MLNNSPQTLPLPDQTSPMEPQNPFLSREINSSADPSRSGDEPTIFSSGYLVFRRRGTLQFLLMKHAERWDLPKGHLDPGETKQQAALREFVEETGLDPNQLWTDPCFAFSHRYWVAGRSSPGTQSLKELTIYLGFLQYEGEIQCTEHLGYQWWNWNPPHSIQSRTIDPLLQSIGAYLPNAPETRAILGLP